MPAQPKGSIFKTRDGYGIRWPEDGRRPERTGFRTKPTPNSVKRLADHG